MYYCADSVTYRVKVEAIDECAVVRDIPEAYLGRVSTEAHKPSHNEPAVVPLEQFPDAHFVCLNLVEMSHG